MVAINRNNNYFSRYHFELYTEWQWHSVAENFETRINLFVSHKKCSVFSFVLEIHISLFELFTQWQWHSVPENNVCFKKAVRKIALIQLSTPQSCNVKYVYENFIQKHVLFPKTTENPHDRWSTFRYHQRLFFVWAGAQKLQNQIWNHLLVLWLG